eukprot:Protomagalhaensia_wolfi_Nauph_80__3837@NODE_3888_length_685_cov_345_241486_g3072_i0_p1_GENE_NODE_3888_length_685_cov_345_241486_g3072_i0NODE_3888_length_685_cov_345_241486_g3072_i0_p1_ORF_typecomplete_len195_score22_32DIL/PF01843_19/0_15_NODE_3888_length_685_cov_345_241486_g3072_i044628
MKSSVETRVESHKQKAWVSDVAMAVVVTGLTLNHRHGLRVFSQEYKNCCVPEGLKGVDEAVFVIAQEDPADPTHKSCVYMLEEGSIGRMYRGLLQNQRAGYWDPHQVSEGIHLLRQCGHGSKLSDSISQALSHCAQTTDHTQAHAIANIRHTIIARIINDSSFKQSTQLHQALHGVTKIDDTTLMALVNESLHS